jgi:ribosomal protein L37AE/L43A
MCEDVRKSAYICPHTNRVEAATFAGSQWVCEDCGEAVDGPGPDYLDASEEPENGTLEEILDVLIEIRDLLKSVVG